MDKNDSHYLGHRKRLRQRFKTAGKNALQDYELLEILLSYAIPRRDTKPLAKKIIQESGSFHQVFDESFDDLEKIDGIGEHASTLIKVVKACISKYLEPAKHDMAVIKSPEAVLGYIRSEIGGQKIEQFMLLCLNAAGRVIHTEIISQGTVNMAHVYPREIVKIALLKSATALILVHNHPSGALTPSVHDEKLTRDLTEMCVPLGITVHDHIIVSKDNAYSMKSGSYIV